MSNEDSDLNNERRATYGSNIRYRSGGAKRVLCVPNNLIGEVRFKLQDYPQYQLLNDGEQEMDDLMLGRALYSAARKYNTIEPRGPGIDIDPLDLSRITEPEAEMLTDWAVSISLDILYNRLSKTRLSYQSGSIQIDENARMDLYKAQSKDILSGVSGQDGVLTRAKEYRMHKNYDGAFNSELSQMYAPFIGFGGGYVEITL